MLALIGKGVAHYVNLLARIALMLALAVPGLADPALDPEVTQATSVAPLRA